MMPDRSHRSYIAADWPVEVARDAAALASIERRLQAGGMERGTAPSGIRYTVDRIGPDPYPAAVTWGPPRLASARGRRG